MVWKKYWESKTGISIVYQFKHKDDERSELLIDYDVANNIWLIQYKPKRFATEQLREFKTKAEALAFARKWMKEHPKG